MGMFSVDAAVNLAVALLQMEAHMHPHHSNMTHSHGQFIPDIPQTAIPIGQLGHAAKAVQTFMIAGVDTGMESNDLVQQLAVPVLALAIGMCLHVMKQHQLTARLLVFFGAQTFMNLYMKIVLSRCVVSKEHGLIGIPAPFIITCLQQVVSCVIVLGMVGIGAFKPRPIQTNAEIISILCLSVAFTFNIALNNFSMALLDLSVNLMIRSFAPLTTYLCQLLVGKVMGIPVKAKHLQSTVLLIIGVSCGALVVFAKGAAIGKSAHSGERQHMYLGIVSALFSLLAAASELNIVAIMGTGTRLNALDACCYMALPSALQLVLPILLWSHPAWAGHGDMNDLAVLREVYALHPRLIVLVFLSGLFALTYNAMLYNIIQALSPAHAAVASNFNKMAVIAIAYILGLEVLPGEPWRFLILFGVLGNSSAFAGFGYSESVQREKEAAEAEAAAEQSAADHKN